MFHFSFFFTRFKQFEAPVSARPKLTHTHTPKNNAELQQQQQNQKKNRKLKMKRHELKKGTCIEENQRHQQLYMQHPNNSDIQTFDSINQDMMTTTNEFKTFQKLSHQFYRIQSHALSNKR